MSRSYRMRDGPAPAGSKWVYRKRCVRRHCSLSSATQGPEDAGCAGRWGRRLRLRPGPLWGGANPGLLCSLQPQLPACPCPRGLAAGPAPSSSAQDLESMSQHPRAQPSSPACTASLPGQAIFSCLDDSMVSPLPADDPHPLHSSWRDCSEAEIRSCRDVPQALRRHFMPSC